MKRRRIAPRRIPRFRSAREEARFWETHSAADYWGSLEKVDEIFVAAPGLAGRIRERARKRLLSLRLEVWQIQRAKEIARRKKKPYQTLLREWIAERIRREVGS